MNNSKNMRKFKAMTHDERAEYMSTANRVTTGTITQIVDKDFVTSHVAKVHGIVVSDGGKFKFATADEARVFGWSILLGWKKKRQELEAESAAQLKEDIDEHKAEQMRGLF